MTEEEAIKEVRALYPDASIYAQTAVYHHHEDGEADPPDCVISVFPKDPAKETTHGGVFHTFEECIAELRKKNT